MYFNFSSTVTLKIIHNQHLTLNANLFLGKDKLSEMQSPLINVQTRNIKPHCINYQEIV